MLQVAPRAVSIDLVVLLSADVALQSPDYGARRQTFTSVYNTISAYPETPILIQSFQPDHPAIQYACAGDLEGMCTDELGRRKQHDYPPYTQMCTLLYKHEIEERLHGATNKLYQELLFLKEQYDLDAVQIYTTPPLVYKMYGKYRYHIILK